jgi:hypothetical protein
MHGINTVRITNNYLFPQQPLSVDTIMNQYRLFNTIKQQILSLEVNKPNIVSPILSEADRLLPG